MNTIAKAPRIIRIKEMLSLLRCSRATLHRWVKNGLFPQPKMVAGKTVGWLESDYLTWLQDKDNSMMLSLK
ncbi:AlpA family transcriptional regulator [Plesiomonas sp. PI-19]|uniref:helix-turn-helix transcriptional regulator n=1 Tax=Plesiomonas sp. PI-19 TaxID=2898798 RepID=UPI001F32618C|nr:AlpA family phage regulatory protein [Plesiomonas sp. PI-19]MCE5164314.1 AlpA family phage regulatory protein [Plesiomonas sp. PI-19]